jgi:hypothetical protein
VLGSDYPEETTNQQVIDGLTKTIDGFEKHS